MPKFAFAKKIDVIFFEFQKLKSYTTDKTELIVLGSC